jgi:tetratricopeptide (TPR) repeat protein
MEMSWTKAQLGRYAEAVADAREVIDSAPQVSPFRLADTWDTLGYAQIGLGEVDQAAGSYHRAVDLYLQHGAPVWAAESLRRLGDVFQRAGREAEAEAAYRRAAGFVEKATGPQAAHLSADLEKILSAMPAR